MKNAENAIMRKEAVDKFCQLEKLVNQKNWSETNPLALVLQKHRQFFQVYTQIEYSFDVP